MITKGTLVQIIHKGQLCNAIANSDESDGYVIVKVDNTYRTEKPSNLIIMPMVDQPQPIDETTIDGEVSFYADGKAQDGTIVCGTDRFGYTVRGVNGKVYDEVQRGDIEPRLGDELYDLPFSDLGVDDEDTKELPAVYIPQVGDMVEYTKLGSDETAIGTVIYADYPYVQIDCDMTLPISRHAKYIRKVESTPTLSNLIDAALDPDDTEAYNALKAYDLASVPLWCIEIEYDDVNYYMWAMWAEAKTDATKKPYVERASRIRHLLQEVTEPREEVNL